MSQHPLFVEYIWIDGGHPTQTLRSKTRVIEDPATPIPLHTDDFGLSDLEWEWTFDGSSTRQAEGGSSDCVLRPVRAFLDPI